VIEFFARFVLLLSVVVISSTKKTNRTSKPAPLEESPTPHMTGLKTKDKIFVASEKSWSISFFVAR